MFQEVTATLAAAFFVQPHIAFSSVLSLFWPLISDVINCHHVWWEGVSLGQPSVIRSWECPRPGPWLRSFLCICKIRPRATWHLPLPGRACVFSSKIHQCESAQTLLYKLKTRFSWHNANHTQTDSRAYLWLYFPQIHQTRTAMSSHLSRE